MCLLQKTFPQLYDGSAALSADIASARIDEIIQRSQRAASETRDSYYSSPSQQARASKRPSLSDAVPTSSSVPSDQQPTDHATTGATPVARRLRFNRGHDQANGVKHTAGGVSTTVPDSRSKTSAIKQSAPRAIKVHTTKGHISSVVYAYCIFTTLIASVHDRSSVPKVALWSRMWFAHCASSPRILSLVNPVC